MSPTNLNVRMTEQEYQEIKVKAGQLGMSISEYVRFVSLHAEVKVEVNQC